MTNKIVNGERIKGFPEEGNENTLQQSDPQLNPDNLRHLTKSLVLGTYVLPTVPKVGTTSRTQP